MTSKGRTLLVINFVVDADDPVLGFATRWLEALRPHVDRLVVLTGQVGEVPDTLDAEIISTNWVPGQNIRNVLRFERELLKTLHRYRPDAVFSHMAAPQAVLAAPWIRLMHRRHVLWYAHTSPSTSLRLASYLVDAIATSVPESCPIQSEKVTPVGQGIDLQRFPRIRDTYDKFEIMAHWGRCDQTKRLDYLVEILAEHSALIGTHFRFLVAGSPSSEENSLWWKEICNNDAKRDRPIVEWKVGVAQSDLVAEIADADAFIHASKSGFDKAALEAAALGIPVFSEVDSIRRELGAPPCPASVGEQMRWYQSQMIHERASYAERQHAAVVENHSLPRLASRLIDL
jgi:glycosyltransferase involved in cell wall biosynthesis